MTCLPNGALPEIFYEPNLNKPRTTRVLVAGALSATVYPIRTRVANLIFLKALDGIVRQHPGYERAFADYL